MYLSHVIILWMCTLCNTVLCDTPFSKEFMLQADGTRQSSIERDGITCTFSYIYQGKATQPWHIIFTQIHEVGTYGCVAESVSETDFASFEWFSLSATGPAVVHQAHAFGAGRYELNTDEFHFNKPNSIVSSVADKFGGSLSRVAIELSKKTEEGEL